MTKSNSTAKKHTYRNLPLSFFKSILLLIILTLLLLSGGCANEPNASTQPNPPPLTSSLPEEAEDEPATKTEDKEFSHNELLAVHFIDVGQGDAIFIQAPAKSILIDGGERGETVVDYLKEKGITSLDLMIGTHPHADHIGGLINVLENIAVAEVIDPAVVHTSSTFDDYLTLIDELDITFTAGRTGMQRDLGGGAKLEILHPANPSSTHLNDASVVVKITFDQISFLFTGDAEAVAETEILKRGADLASTILKVGHHGSRTSTLPAFLEAVNPQAAVIMVGADNSYGHPHEQTLQTLSNAKVDIYRTDLHGTIIISTGGQRFEVNVKEPYQYNPPKIPEVSKKTGKEQPQEDTPAALQDLTAVNINTASLEELQLIIHIGPKRAEEIIRLRPFSSLEDLNSVSGLGPARLADITNQGKATVE